jgi:transcriptional regulator with XRE-family HTH domain
MSFTPFEEHQDGHLRSAALKAIRKHRGLAAATVAKALNMPLRTYERLEAGQGRLNPDYIHRFCRVTNSDPYAVLIGVAIGSPEFASRCADNKLMTILMIAIQAFDRDMGDRIRDEEAGTLIAAFSAAFNTIDKDNRARAAASSAFLETGKAQLLAKRPRPGR